MEKHIVIDENEMYGRFYKALDVNYTLCYVDYRDSIPSDVIEKCIEKKSDMPLYDKDYWGETRWHYAKNELRNLFFKFVNNPYTVEQLELFEDSEQYQQLIQDIFDRDDSNPERDALLSTRTHTRITLHSNYDCWLPLWETRELYLEDSALKGILAMLCLNPAKVKAAALKADVACSGRWPDIKSRNGKEVVDYDQFVECLIECPNYGLWTFFGTLDMQALLDSHFDTSKMTIPKGTPCTMYNSWNGGGSLSDTVTIRDVTIEELIRRGAPYLDAPKVYVDEREGSHGYSSDSVYGQHFSHEHALVA